MIDLNLVRLARDGLATEDELVRLWRATCLLLHPSIRKQTLQSTDPVQSDDDQTQEVWCGLIKWCSSWPDDGLMSPEQWFRTCWRNQSINKYKELRRRRPRNMQSYEGLQPEGSDENPFAPTDDPRELTTEETLTDLIITLDHDLPLVELVKSRMSLHKFKRILGLRLWGLSIHEACQLLKVRGASIEEQVRQMELELMRLYLGYKPCRHEGYRRRTK